MTPGEKIRQQREKLGWSQAELGNRVGISQPAIKKIEDGVTVLSKFLAKIAQVLGLRLVDVMPEIEITLPPADNEPIPPDKILGERDLPIHASVEGGRGQVVITTDRVDTMLRPAPLANVRDAYGIIVTGDSMIPEYESGDTLLINPHLPPERGVSCVFYAEHAGETRATVKRLLRFTVETWHLRQWNPPAGQKQDFTLSRREWNKCHRIVGKFGRR